MGAPIFILYKQCHYRSNNGHIVLSDGPLVFDTPTTSITEQNLDDLVEIAGTLDPKFDPKNHILKTLDGPRRPQGDNDTLIVGVGPEVFATFILKYNHRWK